MNVLVTGGAGFLGSHFVRSSLAGRLPGLEAERVTVVDRLSYAGSFANLGPVAHDKRLDFIPGDVSDTELTDVVMRTQDTVVNFAAETSVDRSVTDPKPFVTSNVLGTQILLDAARRHGVTRFVQISSGAVYGPLPPDAEARREDAPVAPTSTYAATKATADLLVLAAHRTHGLPAAVLRLCSIFGPAQHPEKPVARAATSALTGRPIAVRGAARDWLHVDDCSQAVARVVTDGHPGEIYHAGGSIELTDRDIAGLIAAELDIPDTLIEQAPAAPADDERQALSDEKIRSQLGWHPTVEFDTGLITTLSWYRANTDWWRPLLTF